MNGFEKFGIDHLSASSINLWINAPDLWVMRYLLGKSTPFGAAPVRGQAVEAAVAAMLTGASRDDALAEGWGMFDRRFRIATPETQKERDVIEPMMDHAVAALAPYGVPEFPADGQEKIVIDAHFGDWSIPIWGFLDFVYPQHGLVVDLKTTNRIPSAMSADHQLQRAIYHRAKGNHAVKFAYVSARRAEVLEDGDPTEILASAKVHIARMENFLRHCPDAETARQIVPVNPNTFYWRGAESLLSEIYGL